MVQLVGQVDGDPPTPLHAGDLHLTRDCGPVETRYLSHDLPPGT